MDYNEKTYNLSKTLFFICFFSQNFHGENNTRYCFVNLLRSKDRALEVFKYFERRVENQLSMKIKEIRSN